MVKVFKLAKNCSLNSLNIFKLALGRLWLMLSLISPMAVLRFEPMTYQVLHVVLQLLAH